MEQKLTRKNDLDMAKVNTEKNDDIDVSKSKNFTAYKHVSTKHDSYIQNTAPKLKNIIVDKGISVKDMDQQTIDFLAGKFSGKDVKKSIEAITKQVLKEGDTKERAKELLKAVFKQEKLNPRAEQIIDNYEPNKK